MNTHQHIQQKSIIDSDSSSDSSEEENLEQIFQRNLSKINNKKDKTISLSLKALAVALISLLALTTYYAFRTIVPPTEKLQQTSGTSANSSEITHNSQLQNAPPPTPEKQQSTNQSIESFTPFLKSIENQIQIGNTFFTQQPSQTTNHWIIKKNAVCISDLLINSATQIDQNLYAQQSAYEKIIQLSHNVNIPAQNIYAFEAARQFVYNMSITYPSKTIVYDHQSPLLLVLIIRHYPKGIFVSDRQDWPLFQKNLVLNDLYPLANKYPHQQLMLSQSSDIIITSDLDTTFDLILNKKREVIALMDFSQPTPVKTAYLLKLKVYRLSQGEQCSNRQMLIFEQADWRVNQQVSLTPGWYVFCSIDNDISFQTKTFNYEEPLLSDNPFYCLSDKLYYDKRAFFKATQMNIMKTSYTPLYLFDKQLPPETEHYREVYGYLTKSNLWETVYIDSGPLYALLVVVASLPIPTSILLASQYPHKKQLLKLLILNNQEKVTTTTLSHNQLPTFDLAVTDRPQALQSLHAKQYLFLNQQQRTPMKQFVYTHLKPNQCSQPTQSKVISETIAKGVFIVEKII